MRPTISFFHPCPQALVNNLSLPLEALLSALDSLPRLQCLLGSGWMTAFTDAGEPVPTRLRAGPLFSRLRWLALDWELLLHNPQLLDGAAHLHMLCLVGCCSTQPGAKYGRLWAPFWRQCERLPALRHIILHVWRWEPYQAQPLPAVLKGIAALRRKRPEVECLTVEDPEEGAGALLFPGDA